ncbi:MAG: RimK family protein [Alphaproteobacteria bacterium]|nr:RimK family protein [Alphaproteobacteria bacterium]
MMVRHIIVVNRMSDWRWSTDGLTVQDVDAYTSHPAPKRKRPARVVNLCRTYEYLSSGYYCSLLAESRGEFPMPTVADILDLSRKSSYAYAVPDLERILKSTMKRLADPPADAFVLRVFFGRPDDARFKSLAAELFDVFRYPLLEMRVHSGRTWKIDWIRPFALKTITDDASALFEDALRAYVRVPKAKRKAKAPSLYDLAVLVDPQEALPPSDEKALQRLVRAGQERAVNVEFITAKDFRRIPEFDALFIRETTALDHHTFRFARKAEVEGIPVIDDSRSILRCTNKVYLAEALKAAKVPTPRTELLVRAKFDARRMEDVAKALGYPLVLKIPDGSFSRGVEKADDAAGFRDHAAKLFERSSIILAQEYMYTPFDWRVGLLAGEPLYACRYFMSRKHWQIYHHHEGGKVVAGGWETLPVESVPAEVLDTAQRAAALMGDGFYGVDLKQNDDGVFVIEVNDNPSIDSGVEDQVLKGALYGRLIDEFIRRINKARNG